MFAQLIVFLQTLQPDPWQHWQLQVAVFVGLATALLAIAQASLSYHQRRREFRWKQAELAQKSIEEILKFKPSFNALTMIDEINESFTTDEGKVIEVSQHDIDEALTVPVKDHSEKAKYIRHCFDVLFFYVERIEQSIAIKLIRWEDVRKPTDYYAERLALHKKTILNYLTFTKYHGVKSFLNRFSEWTDVDV